MSEEVGSLVRRFREHAANLRIEAESKIRSADAYDALASASEALPENTQILLLRGSVAEGSGGF